MAKAILRKTEAKVAVKLYGATLNETVSLAVDCLASTEALTAGGTPTANIQAVTWTGTPGSVITITRNAVVILTVPVDAAGFFDFSDKEFSDNIENTSNIVVTSTGGIVQLYMILRKVTGYSSKIETAQFGSYDNTTLVGS